jgi:hypothetical protein
MVSDEAGASRGCQAHPSSFSRNRLAEPESLDMKTMVPMGMLVCSSFCAVMMGPIVLVWR